MTLLTNCVIANCRRSSADHHLHASATNMESSGEVVDPADVGGDPARYCPSTTSLSPPGVATANAEDPDDLPTGNGSSFVPPDELESTPVSSRSERSSPSVFKDAKTPVLSFSVAAIMAKTTSPPASRTDTHSAVVELNSSNSNNNNIINNRHRHRQDCGPISLVSPLAASPRRLSAFTVDGILNGVGRTSSRPASADDGDESSCSAADDSESNRSSPGDAPSTAAVPAANASVTARQNLPFLHPAGPAIDVACKWPPAGCPYPWQYVNPPSELYSYTYS